MSFIFHNAQLTCEESLLSNNSASWETVIPGIRNNGIRNFSYNTIALQEAILQCVTGP